MKFEDVKENILYNYNEDREIKSGYIIYAYVDRKMHHSTIGTYMVVSAGKYSIYFDYSVLEIEWEHPGMVEGRLKESNNLKNFFDIIFNLKYNEQT